MLKEFALRPSGPPPRHRLDAGKIVETAKNLAEDVEARLPGSTLAGLARELVGIAAAAQERGQKVHRPILAIRILSALAVGLVVLALWFLARHIHTRWEFATITEVFEAVHTGFELLVLLVGALWFLVTFEARIKRREALQSIEELREFIHVVDVTQLYYTPDLYRSRHGTPLSHVAIDESYLLFSTQMLAVIGNLAPLYARGVTGEAILRAASDVEMLAIGVATKHLSKAEAVLMMGRDHPAPSPSPGG